MNLLVKSDLINGELTFGKTPSKDYYGLMINIHI